MWLTVLVSCGGNQAPECPAEQLVDAWVDADGDGFGGGDLLQTCGVSPDHVDRGGDCDDGDPDIHPDVLTELCNGRDDDCDGLVDQGLPTTLYFTDADGDGFGTAFPAMRQCGTAGPGWVGNEEDCDDTNPNAHPDAQEVCNGGIDDDCDYLSDDSDDSVDRSTYTPFYEDVDADGYGDPTTYDGACVPPANSVTDGTDCDDLDPGRNPGMVETCTQRDDDCDGLIDDADPSLDTTTQRDHWRDADADGYGDPDQPMRRCWSVVGVAVDDASDCDDMAPQVHPGATDVCNGIDDDCTPFTNEDDVSGAPWYDDPDGDGYGIAGTEIYSCTPLPGRGPWSGDCNEADPTIHPHAPDECDDAIDHDCDGEDCNPCEEIVVGFPQQWALSTSNSLAWQDLESRALSIGDCPLVTIDLPNSFTLAELQASDVNALWMGDSGVAVQYTLAMRQVMRDFAAQGGGIVFTFLVHQNNLDNSPLVDLVGIDPAGINVGNVHTQSDVDVLEPFHPIADQLPNRFSLSNYLEAQRVQGDWSDWLLPGAEVVMESNDGTNVVIGYDNGVWRGALMSAFPEYNLADNEAYVVLYNTAYWVSGY